jgi:hypothetical protein
MRMYPEYLLALALGYLVIGLGWCLVFPPRPDVADDDESLTGEKAAA